MPTVMSVFGVEPFRIGGTEAFARELSLQLEEHGWNSVICFQSEPPDEVRCFLDLPNVTLEILRDAPTITFKGLREFTALVRRYGPDIVHLHFTGFLSPYPWLARLNSVPKILFTDHTSRPAGYVTRRAPFWKRITARAINLPLSKVISVSNYGYDCMVGLDLLPRKRYQLVYNAVDLARVHPDPARGSAFRKRYSVPPDRTVVLQVSWIIPEKGIPELLKAARLVISRFPKVQFVLVGEGAYRGEYTKEAQSMGLGDHITWTGLVEDPFAAGVYDAADVVCQVSNWEEVFGWMIAEAMAFQKPIVAARVGGIPELVADGESGFLVERGDVSAMAEKICSLLEQPELRMSAGRAGSVIVQRKFDLSRNVAQLVGIYGLQKCDESAPHVAQANNRTSSAAN